MSNTTTGKPQGDSTVPHLDRWQELEAMQLLAEFLKRHNVTDYLVVSLAAYQFRELVRLDAVTQYRQAVAARSRGAA